MTLSKSYQPKEIENKIYRFWEESGFFNPDKLPKRQTKSKTFTIMLPPPNITGSLHMGHALNATVQDILIRRKRMQGYLTLWLPGTDHAGIAAQNVVEKQLKKEGLTRFDIGREKFLERMWQWKEKYGHIILDQLKKLGASCDWSRQVFTMDKNYAIAVKTAFLDYYQKGWIYRAERVVNWCPRCQTSLSDLELEYKQEQGKLWYLKYPLKEQNYSQKKYITVATTRPETMLGDTAVAVNPKDKRYQNLIGQKVILPLANREIPVIADSLVDPNFGTGIVKITPGHDFTDYEIGLRHNLPVVKAINEKGKIAENMPLPYKNLFVSEARQKIIQDLEKLNLLEKSEDYTHQVPKCYRCDTTIEILPSKQWFLKMDKLAKMALQAVKSGKVRFIPKKWEKVYFDWLKNVKDWCISRQIWWGHRIPVWYCQDNKTKNNKNQCQFIASVKKPKKCPNCKSTQVKPVLDVLDTWFSSALWPFATLGWPKKTKDLQRFYPTDVLSTDRGIINLWVARMIFSGIEFMKKEPFRDVYIHATVLTKEGKRMSKSLGTGTDPLELVEKYGADATRFGIAWQITDLQDIRFVEDNIVAGRKFCNKLYNAARFVLLQIPNSRLQLPNKFKTQNSKQLTLADKKIIEQLNRTVKQVNENINHYQFGKAVQKLYHFFWHEFCDKYIEQSKVQLKNPKLKKQTQKILLYVLLTSLKLSHPFMPFITEEIYQKLPLKNKAKCLMIEKWPRI